MPPLQVRDLPQDIYERLCRCAERERRSLAQQTTWIIERFLDMYESGAKAPYYRYDPAEDRLTMQGMIPSEVTIAELRLVDEEEARRRVGRRQNALDAMRKVKWNGEPPTGDETVELIREIRGERIGRLTERPEGANGDCD